MLCVCVTSGRGRDVVSAWEADVARITSAYKADMSALEARLSSAMDAAAARHANEMEEVRMLVDGTHRMGMGILGVLHALACTTICTHLWCRIAVG